MRLTWLMSIVVIAGGATLSAAHADDNRFQRYFDSVGRCGVIGYCKTTAADILNRGPTGGRSQPFLQRDRQDDCRYLRRYGHSCRVQYQPRGAHPEMYVDIVPSNMVVVRRASTPEFRRSSAKHVAWCKDRYRSYRVQDNTFQPNKGNRKQCKAPTS